MAGPCSLSETKSTEKKHKNIYTRRHMYVCIYMYPNIVVLYTKHFATTELVQQILSISLVL